MSEENNLQVSKQSDEQFCSSCGKPIKIKAEICPHCGVRQIPVNEVWNFRKRLVILSITIFVFRLVRSA